jgi:CheY-like chemotaxis protein
LISRLIHDIVPLKIVLATDWNLQQTKVNENRMAALEAGMNGHLLKPIDPQQMIGTLGKILG